MSWLQNFVKIENSLKQQTLVIYAYAYNLSVLYMFFKNETWYVLYIMMYSWKSQLRV